MITKDDLRFMDNAATNAIKDLIILSGHMKNSGLSQEDYDIPAEAARDIAQMMKSILVDVYAEQSDQATN